MITFIAISIKYTPIKYQTYKNKDGVSAPQLIKLSDLSRQINTDKFHIWFNVYLIFNQVNTLDFLGTCDRVKSRQ